MVIELGLALDAWRGDVRAVYHDLRPRKGTTDSRAWVAELMESYSGATFSKDLWDKEI